MSFFGSRNSILVFAVVTALIHLALGLSFFGDFLGKAFVANAIGYSALTYALLWKPSFLKGQESMVKWAFMGFTAVTIVMYFVFNGAHSFVMEGGGINFPGLITKLDEALLIFSLWRYSN